MIKYVAAMSVLLMPVAQAGDWFIELNASAHQQLPGLSSLKTTVTDENGGVREHDAFGHLSADIGYQISNTVDMYVGVHHSSVLTSGHDKGSNTVRAGIRYRFDL